MEPNELKEIVRENIRSMRRGRGMTQQQLADSLGVTQGFIAQIESGKSAISLDMLAQIATALGTMPNVLLTRGIFSQLSA